MPVQRAGGQQFLLLSLSNESAIFHHNDVVCAGHRTQPVGNDDQRLALCQPGDSLLNDRFILRVDAGSGFVENDDGCILQHGAGNGNALLFAAGKMAAAPRRRWCRSPEPVGG